MRRQRPLFRCALLLVMAAAPTHSAPDDAARIADAMIASDAYFHPDQPAPIVTLDGCQLTIDDSANLDAFGGVDHVYLPDLDLRQPAFVYEMNDAMWRLDVRSSHASEQARAPAVWRLMGGSDATRPPVSVIIERSREWDPLGLGDWSDPSFITRWQQGVYDAAWARALDGEGGAELARSHSEWLGPSKGDWRPVWRNPGAFLQVALPPDEVQAFMSTLRRYVAEVCP